MFCSAIVCVSLVFGTTGWMDDKRKRNGKSGCIDIEHVMFHFGEGGGCESNLCVITKKNSLVSLWGVNEIADISNEILKSTQ